MAFSEISDVSEINEGGNGKKETEVSPEVQKQNNDELSSPEGDTDEEVKEAPEKTEEPLENGDDLEVKAPDGQELEDPDKQELAEGETEVPEAETEKQEEELTAVNDEDVESVEREIEEPLKTEGEEPEEVKGEVNEEPLDTDEGEETEYTKEELDELALDVDKVVEMASQNDDSDRCTLGKYYPDGDSRKEDSYEQVAQRNDTSYYQLDPKMWDELSDRVGKDNMFEYNRKYLDNQMEQGKEFVSGINPWDENNLSGAFLDELNYLYENGYMFSETPDDDGLYHAVYYGR